MNISKSTYIIGFIAVVAIILIGWMLISGSANQSPTPTPTPTAAPVKATPAQSELKEFTVTGTPFKFEPAEIKVKQGDKVRITFKNDLGMHNLTITDLNIASKTIQKGEQDTIEFIADKIGTFQYNCSVPTHTEKGMLGSLVVE